MPSAASGILWLDIVLRPFVKFAVKFPIVGFVLLLVLYGAIGYFVLKSAYMDSQYD